MYCWYFGLLIKIIFRIGIDYFSPFYVSMDKIVSFTTRISNDVYLYVINRFMVKQ